MSNGIELIPRRNVSSYHMMLRNAALSASRFAGEREGYPPTVLGSWCSAKPQRPKAVDVGVFEVHIEVFV